jgi:hypothetical protein
MEDVSEKSCQGFGIDRFLCGIHREIQSAVRFDGSRPSSSQGCPPQKFMQPSLVSRRN